MLNVVLYAPRIPQNTGQIARACHAMGCRLHLIRPLGFRVDAPALKRAAVGYLGEIDFTVHQTADAFWQTVPDRSRAWLVTKHGKRAYTDADWRDGDWIVLGNETEGLPRAWLDENPNNTLVIPMRNPDVRCLNLATSVVVVMFEALRQIGIQGER
ncbi:tRNA (cytidine(34)-2'-O)-methyltransferase [bacterium]|nr:tRNA (cytidine(34)-2'-O)-methyltransferase [bacterium]